MLTNTVAAVSTAPGKGGIAVIRISGDDTLNIIGKCFSFKLKSKGSDAGTGITPRFAYYGEITDSCGNVIDDGILTFYKSPNSFTGEDMAEISCHGGIYVTYAVLAAVFEAGAEAAGAGEFTKRSFLNGKLSLSRAEAVSLIIDAKSNPQLKLASSLARGALSVKLNEIRDLLLSVTASAMVIIDYPDEDLADTGRDGLAEKLSKIVLELENLARTYKMGKGITEGVVTVICGKTNAGKSSLFNLLTGSEKAIVTEIEGTTRDVLEDTVSLGNITLNLRDTAGLRETSDIVESIGVKRAREQIAGAEMIIAVFDRSRSFDSDDMELINEIKSASEAGAAAVAVINKNDLPNVWEADKIKLINDVFAKTVEMNMIDQDERDGGISALSGAVADLYSDGLVNLDISRDAVIVSERQRAAVVRSAAHARSAVQLLLCGHELDIALSEAEQALIELEMADGRQVSEEIVGEIFARFCVGK